MQLYYSPTSPFARKVKILLMITGLIDKTKIIVTSFDSDQLRTVNPLGKVPALIDAKTTLFDSPLICEYLDEKYEESGHASLFHCGKADYYRVQSAHALANGILDAAVSSMMESRRETEPSPYWLGRWKTAVETGIKNINIDILDGASNPNIATIATMAALGYLDFRLPQYDWRSWNPELTGWYNALKDESWFTETAPPQDS